MKLLRSSALRWQLALLAAALCVAGWALARILQPANMLGLLLVWSNC